MFSVSKILLRLGSNILLFDFLVNHVTAEHAFASFWCVKIPVQHRGEEPFVWNVSLRGFCLFRYDQIMALPPVCLPENRVSVDIWVIWRECKRVFIYCSVLSLYLWNYFCMENKCYCLQSCEMTFWIWEKVYLNVFQFSSLWYFLEKLNCHQQ